MSSRYPGGNRYEGALRADAQFEANRKAIERLERERLRCLDLKTLRRLWDQYDGTNSPLGFSGEGVHFELYMRGDGRYCAV